MIGLSTVAVTGLISTIPDDKITEALTNEAFPLDENGKPDRAHPFYPRQSRDGEELQGFSAAASIRAAVTNPWFWKFCREVFPNNNIINTGRPGAPQHYPDWLLFLLYLSAGLRDTGTVSKSQNFFKDVQQWNDFAAYIDQWVPEDMTRIRDIPARRVRTPRPVARPGTAKSSRTRAHKPELRLVRPAHLEPKVPGPSGHHLDHFIRRFRGVDKTKSTKKVTVRFPVGHRDYGIREKALAAFQRVSIDQATAMGLLNPDIPLVFQKPDRNQFVGADGVVFQVPRKGENPTAALYDTGVGRVYGTKFTIFSIRISGQYHSRVILDFRHTHKDHGDLDDPAAQHLVTDESRACLDVMPQIKALAGAGLHGLLVDSVVRGRAVEELQRQAINVVNYPHAESNPNKDEGGRLAEGRVEKNHLRAVVKHEVRDFTGRKAECLHPIYAVGGELMEAYIDDQGQSAVRPVKIVSHERRGDAIARQYHRVHIPCSMPHAETGLASGVVDRIPLFHDGKGENALHEVNWGEVVRIWAPGSLQFKYLYGARNDTEARHSDLKARMKYLPRDVAGQELRLLGASMAANLMAWQVHLQAHEEPNVIDNTA